MRIRVPWWVILPVALLAAALIAPACFEDSKTVVERPVVLLENGASEHVIVLEDGASPSEQHAAEELQAHLAACTGVTLPIGPQPTDDTPMIVLGQGETARSLGVDPDPADLGEQGYVVHTAAPHIVIAGTRAAGTMYGVHRFLEDHLGVRWYAPGVTRTPEASDLVIPDSGREVRAVKPAFFYRYTSYEWPGADAAFWARQANNNGDDGADSPTGIQHDLRGSAHTYHKWLSPSEFFDEHPEYFSEIGGERVREETQLCLTNPDVLEIVSQRMLERLRREPDTRQLTFSQMDRYNYCQCDRCRAMNEKYKTLGGTQFWFVNQLAERITQEFPDVWIRTLAYMYTEEPPVGLQMHPSAAVWICHMYPSCDSHPIATCPHNAEYKRRAEAWAGLTDHLYVWHYIVDFTHYYNPFPNFRAMAADIRYYRDIGVEGVFLQGMGHSGGGGEWSLLRPYYGMKLLWDPDQDEQALRREFLQGYYGAAWEPLDQYIELLHDKVEQDEIHMHLYTNPAQGYLTDEIMARAGQLFDRAEAAVKDDAELLERVRVARMPLAYAASFPRNGYEIVGDTLKWRDDMSDFAALQEFMDRMEAHGFRTAREVAGDPELLLLAYSILSSDLEIVPLENDHLRVEIVPMLAGRALRIIHKASGQCVTAYDRKKVLYFPFAGGLEDRIGGIFRFYGWVEPATVLERSATSVRMSQLTLEGEYGVERTLTLDPDEPVLRLRTVLTNTAATDQEMQLRTHIELDLGELRQTRVRFTALDGQSVDQDVSAIVDNLREGEHFYDQDAPRGSWTLSGTKGLELTQRWSRANIDFTWLYAYPESDEQLELEVWARKQDLQPGESMTLEHEIEVRPATRKARR